MADNEDQELLLWQHSTGVWLVTLFCLGLEQQGWSFPSPEQAMGGLRVIEVAYPFARLTIDKSPLWPIMGGDDG